ncbi:MAG: hypothetical protein WAL23_01265, partial [Nitrososphaeraceae archaeon]
MNNSRPIVNISLLLGTIIAVSAFFLVFNNIPVQALHKEQQLLESFDDLADFANAVKNGDEELEEIPIQSMKDADIYDDADDNLKDCIDLAAEIGDSLTDKEVVHCVDDVNYFKNKLSNSTVPTNAASATTGVADTGSDTTSTSDTADTTSTSNADTNAADTKTSNADTNAADTTSSSNADTNAADTKTSNADTNAADTKTSDADTNTDVSSASDDTSSTNNEDNNDQSSNNNSNNPDDYDDLDVLVNDIKNGDVDTDEISLSAFQDSGAYQGADQETQDCIDLAGK